MKLEFHNTDELVLAELRGVREGTVEDIKDRIEENGFNPSRPLRVVQENGQFIVADGNHRLKALRKLEFEDEVPCVVESDVDLHRLAIESNRDEDTYAKMDLFDYLDMIDDLRDSHTQAEIGEKLGWSRSKVAKYASLLENVVPTVRELARSHQKGRGTDDVPMGTFSERWFRDTGIYGLEAEWVTETEDEPKHVQVRFMEWYCNERNCDASSTQIERKIDELGRIQEQLETFENGVSEAVEDKKKESKRQEIIRGELSDSQVEDAIETLNEGAKDQYHFGEDALEAMRDIPDNEVDIVLTDPPYGVDFESHRETDNPDYDTGKDEILDYLAEVFSEVKRISKANSHIYMFFPIDFMCELKELAKQHFKVNETPLIWVKNNHGPMTGGKSFKEMHAHKYETIFLFRRENGYERKLNKNVSPNVLEYAKPTGEDRWHDSQKPQALLEDIITNSTGEGEVVFDPFAGSGATLLAAANTDRHFIGIEKNDEYEARFKRELGKIE